MGIFGDLNLGAQNVEGVNDSLLDQQTDLGSGGEVDETDPFNTKTEEQRQEELKQNNNISAGGSDVMLSNEDVFTDTVNQQLGQQLAPTFSQTADEMTPGEFISPEKIDANIVEQFGNSLARGTGSVLGGLGDIFQAAGGAMGSAFGDPSWWQGNALSDLFHGWDDSIANANQNFVPDEFKEVQLSNLSSVEGWKYLIGNQLAETIPYMAEFVLTGFGAGSLAKKGASVMAKKAVKNYAKKGLLKSAVKGVGRDGVEYGGKRSISSLLLTEKGLSKTGGQMAHAFGAGAANNQMIAITQAAESVNEAKLLKDAQGNPLFTDDELAEIAKDTYLTESAYIAADIASWAFTFGKVDKGLFRMAGLNKAPSASKAFGAKAMKRIAKTGFKAGVEGAEETVQEVFEEWAKKKSIEEAKMKKGLISQNKYEGFKGFTDYYTSKETEGLRVVAGLMGGLMAGGKTSLDLMAEKSRLLSDKEELLKVRMPKAADGDIQFAQELAKRRVIADIVHNNRQDDLNMVMADWVKNGSMTQEEYTETLNEVNEFADLFEKSQNLSVEGADQLYYLLSEKNNAKKNIANESEILANKQKDIASLDISEEAKKSLSEKAVKEFNEANAVHQKVLEKAEKSINNHILGKRMEASVDKETGDIKGYRGFNKQDYETFTETGKAEKSVKKDVLETGSTIAEKAKGVASDISSKVEKIADRIKPNVSKEQLAKLEEDSKTLTDEEVSSIKEEFGVNVAKDENGEYQFSMDGEFDEAKVDSAREKATEILNAKKQQLEDAKGGDRPSLIEEIKTAIKSGNIPEKFKNIFKLGKDGEVELSEEAETKKEAPKADETKKEEKVTETKKDADTDTDTASDEESEYEKKFKKFSEAKTSDKKSKEVKPDEKRGIAYEGKKSLKDTGVVEGRFKKGEGETKSVASEKINTVLNEISSKINEKITPETQAKVKANLQALLKGRNLSESQIASIKSLIKKADIQGKINSLKDQLSEVKIPRRKRDIQNQIDKLQKKLSSRLRLPKINKVEETLTWQQEEKLYNADEIHSVSSRSYDTANYAKLLVIRKNLQSKFPGVNIGMVNDLSQVLGSGTLGYAIGSSIYIDGDSVNQPRVIAHEISHVYYNLTKDSPATKRMMDYLLKNTALTNKVKNQYWDQVSFKVQNEDEGVESILDARSLREAGQFKGNSNKELVEFLSDYGTVTELPLNEQEVIKDEVFAYHMENNLTAEYDNFFNPKEKNRANFYTKKFWQNVKNKLTFGLSKTDKQLEMIDFLNDLDEQGVPTQEKHLRTYIMNNFKKGFNKADFKDNLRGLRKIDEKLASSAETSLRNQRGVYDLSDSGIDSFMKQSDFIFDSEFAQDDDVDTTETSILDDKNPAYNRSISNMIVAFERDYNRKFYNRRAPLDKFKLKFALDVLAQQSKSNLDFIKAIENAENHQLQQFTKWLDAFYENDYQARLISIHTSMANNVYMDSFSIEEEGKGISVVPGLSEKDSRSVSSVMDGLKSMFESKIAKNKNFTQESKAKMFDELKALGEDIKKGRKVSNEQLKKGLRTIVGGENIDSSLNDVVYVDGKPMTVKSALKAFLEKSIKPAKDKRFNNLEFIHLRPFVKSLVSANKYKTGSSTVQNVEGNNISMYQKSNFIVSELRNISRDIASMTDKDFARKYDRNPLAMKMKRAGKIVHMQQFLGLKTKNKASIYKKGTKDELFVNDMILFLKGGANSYMQSVMMNADSPRRYYASVPKIITTKMNSDQVSALYKEAAELAKRNGDRRFLDANGRSSSEKVSSVIENETNKIIDKMTSNKSLYSSLQKKIGYSGKGALLDKNGKITSGGRKIIKSYVTNHLMNQLYFRDLFAPQISEFDLNKRGKASTAPYTPVNSTGKLKLGLIALQDKDFRSELVAEFGDEFAGEVSSTDSMNIMLPEDVDRVQAIYGGTMKVGKNLKFVNFSKERENKNLRGKGIYLKGIAFPLSDEFVEKYPKYKPLRDVMRAQKQHYIDNHTGEDVSELSFNLNDGKENFMPIAYALSGIKTGLTKEQRDSSVTLDELADTEKALEKINSLNEYTKPGRNNKGYGIDGSNLGIQNLMDKEYDGAVFATQLASNLYINASQYGTLSEVENISQIMNEISEEAVVKKVLKSLPQGNNVTNEDIKKIKDFVLKNTNPDLIDPITSAILKKHSISLPYVQDRVSQIMKNKIVREGNKLYTDGGVGLQMSDYGFLGVEDGVLKSNELKPYGVGAEGKTWIDTKGNSRNATVPAEAIVPQYIADKGAMRLREYVSNESAARRIAKSIAEREANKLYRPDSSKYKNYVSKHTELLIGEDEKGSFVRGEMFLGTRIPSHGLQTTLILEAKNTTGSDMGSAIIVPSELSAIMGSDLDGDAIYMNTRNTSDTNIGKKKDKLRLSTIDYMTGEAMQEDMLASLNMEEEKKNVIDEIKENLGVEISFERKQTSSFTYPFLPTGQEESYNDNLQTRNLVGLAASLHRFLNMISAYDTKFDLDLQIGDLKAINSFSDQDTGIKARYYKTATLLNVILDNAKERMAEKIGITPSTASQFILLAGMGYDVKTIASIMNSDGAKAWIQASENRNNAFYESGNKYDVLENARKIANVKGSLVDEAINIDVKNLNSEDSKRNVIEMLSKLDTMQSELFKVNRILSGHKKLETNPFVLENQLEEANKLMLGSGMIKYDERFRKNPVVDKYVRNHKNAIDVDKKANVAYNKSNRNIMSDLQKMFKKDLKPNEYAIIKNKLLKISYLRPMMKGYGFTPSEFLGKIYGDKNNSSLFDDLVIYKNNLSEKDYNDNSLLKDGIHVINQFNEKRVSINPNLLEYGNEKALEKMRSDFSKLPTDLQDKLIIYDFIENGFRGKRSIFPLFDNDAIEFFEYESDKLLRNSNKSLPASELNEIKGRLVHSLHDMIPKLNYNKVKFNQENNSFVKGDGDLATPGSKLFMDITENEGFFKVIDNPNFKNKTIAYYAPLTQTEINNIALREGVTEVVNNVSDFPLHIQQGIVNNAKFKVFKVINREDIGTDRSPLYKDLNLLTYNPETKPTGPKGDSGKKLNDLSDISTSTGRRRLEGSENFTFKMSKEEWMQRNGFLSNSAKIDKKYEEYTNQFNEAKQFIADNDVESMSVNELKAHLNHFYQKQAEAVSIATNPLRNELGIRLSQEQTTVTGKKERGDLSGIQKWLVSSNISSRLPGMQKIAKTINEKYKQFLRERNVRYNEIKKVTEALYKDKFGKSLIKYNPFKNKDYYRTLYGNLIVEEVVGDKSVRNIRLKDKEVVEYEFSKGMISRAEKDFYDTFTSITGEYGKGLSEEDRRRGYIPHTSQSLFESYANRGILGAFMNSQTTDQRMNDVVLKGYDPIRKAVVKQTYKKFKDAYDAVSQNKDEGNQNTVELRKIFMIKKRAERLAKKGFNEDGTPIRMSNIEIDTLMDGGAMNRFTHSRSNKATEFPSMDLNKALMDYTHASIFNKNFRSMLPEIDAMITYYQNIGNKNAVEIIEKYYKQKILRGQRVESFLGKTGDNVVRTINAVTVFKFLGFNTAVVGGNVLAGKYHNIKNNGGEAWLKGEKRFWGLHNLKKGGIKGVYRDFKKSMELLNRVGFMEQNIYEEVNLEKEWNPITKLQNLAFLPMTLSEKWIQGVQFLGQLSDEEWDNWVNKGELISVEKQTEYEEKVKASQGRGYNYTDQRLISLYSLGQTLMMFNRFIPTMMVDRFGPEEIDAYGRKHIGSLNQFGQTAKDVLSGRMKLSEYKKYKESLPAHKAEALEKALRGMSLVTFIGLFGAGAGALGDDETEKTANKLVADANYAINLPKLAKKTNLPAVSSTKEIINSIFN